MELLYVLFIKRKSTDYILDRKFLIANAFLFSIKPSKYLSF